MVMKQWTSASTAAALMWALRQAKWQGEIQLHIQVGLPYTYCKSKGIVFNGDKCGENYSCPCQFYSFSVTQSVN